MEKIVIKGIGMTAVMIDRANRASFYGIFGDKPDCRAALNCCHKEVKLALSEAGAAWNQYEILDAVAYRDPAFSEPHLARITAIYE